MSKLDTHWNNLMLPLPPQATIIINKKLKDVSLSQFIVAIQSMEKAIKKLDLNHLAALCSRLIYKLKLKFRSTKWMKIMQKINTSLLKLLQFKINETFSHIICMTSLKENQLPSQPVLEWFLIKLQGYVRLLVRIIVTCYHCALVVRKHLTIGHNLHVLFIIMSWISHLWSNSQIFLKEGCKLYNLTFSMMTQIDLDQKLWSSYELPTDLSEWIQKELITLGHENILKVQLPHVKSLKEINHQIETNQEEDEDMGEIISRQDLDFLSKAYSVEVTQNETNKISSNHEVGTSLSETPLEEDKISSVKQQSKEKLISKKKKKKKLNQMKNNISKNKSKKINKEKIQISINNNNNDDDDANEGEEEKERSGVEKEKLRKEFNVLDSKKDFSEKTEIKKSQTRLGEKIKEKAISKKKKKIVKLKIKNKISENKSKCINKEGRTEINHNDGEKEGMESGRRGGGEKELKTKHNGFHSENDISENIVMICEQNDPLKQRSSAQPTIQQLTQQSKFSDRTQMDNELQINNKIIKVKNKKLKKLKNILKRDIKMIELKHKFEKKNMPQENKSLKSINECNLNSNKQLDKTKEIKDKRIVNNRILMKTGKKISDELDHQLLIEGNKKKFLKIKKAKKKKRNSKSNKIIFNVENAS